jgi:hypothetical protein
VLQPGGFRGGRHRIPSVVCGTSRPQFAEGAFYQFSGAGSATQAAWFFRVTLHIGTLISYQVPVGFTAALEGLGFGLLGQNGFFDRFKVEFDLRNKVFFLEGP